MEPTPVAPAKAEPVVGTHAMPIVPTPVVHEIAASPAPAAAAPTPVASAPTVGTRPTIQQFPVNSERRRHRDRGPGLNRWLD